MAELPQSQPIVRLHGGPQRFFVDVRPCPDDQPSSRAFDDYLIARAEARLLRPARGCQLVDEVPAPVRKAAEEADQARLEARRGG